MRTKEQNDPSLKGKSSILLIDNNADTLKILTVILKEEGYAIETAGDGETALNKVAENHPKVILLDMMLPRMNGVEICKRLKQNPATRPIPVIIMTAKSKDEAQTGMLAAGAQDYLLKPFEPTELVQKVKTFTRERAS